MHETVIVNKLLEDAKVLAKGKKIKSIHIMVGELAHIPAEEIKPFLKDMLPFEFTVEETESMVECECGYKGRPNIVEKGHDITIYLCPRCKAIPAKVLAGDQIVIKSIEVI